MRFGTDSHHGFILVEAVSHSVAGDDPLGRALSDYHRGEREEPLVNRDGLFARLRAVAVDERFLVFAAVVVTECATERIVFPPRCGTQLQL